MGTNEYSQPASKSSWDSQDFGDVNMVVKMAHFHKSSRPQWVNIVRLWEFTYVMLQFKRVLFKHYTPSGLILSGE